MNEPSRGAERFGVVLILLFVTFSFMAAGPTGDWVPFVTVVLQGATLLAAIWASETGKRLRRLSEVIVAVGIAAELGIWLTGATNHAAAGFLVNVVLVGVAPFVIAASLVRRRVIDLHTVAGALCIYVLLGMLWAFGFAAIGEISSGQFFAQSARDSVADYLYFSYVTLTTVGYGDLTAASSLGRAIAMLEALVGQLYLVSVVALVVSQIGRARAPRT